MEDMAKYITGCSHYQKVKADRNLKKTKLVSILTGERPWKEIAMDFVEELLKSDGYNAILVITDHFTKMQYYILDKTSWTSEDVVNAYLYDIWRLYGLFKYIISNRGPQFALAFSIALNDKLGIRL